MSWTRRPQWLHMTRMISTASALILGDALRIPRYGNMVSVFGLGEPCEARTWYTTNAWNGARESGIRNHEPGAGKVCWNEMIGVSHRHEI